MFYEKTDVSEKFASLEQAVSAAHAKPKGTNVIIKSENDGSKFWCVIAKVEGLIEVGTPMSPLRP